MNKTIEEILNSYMKGALSKDSMKELVGELETEAQKEREEAVMRFAKSFGMKEMNELAETYLKTKGEKDE